MAAHSASRQHFIGEAVNIAARVEALTRTLKVDVLLTEATAHHLTGEHQLTEQAIFPVQGTWVTQLRNPRCTAIMQGWPDSTKEI